MKRRTVLFLLSAFSFLLFLTYFFRTSILTGIAQAYIVNEPLQKADAIVVPGGGIGWRPIEAARLYHEGYAPKILIMDVKPDSAVEVGVREPDRDLMRQVLIKKGVPDTNIVAVGKAVSNTWDDISAAREWGKAARAKRLIVVTDLFHTRRVKWITRKLLDKSDIESEVRAVTPPEYTATNWWRHEEGLIMFQNELVKFGFYMARH
jgi:uncharacterized SAM-binding protein YcdF (DUF218 family)